MIFLNLYLLLPFNQCHQICILSCETALQPSSFLTFIISNFGSDLTTLQTTFRGNNRSFFQELLVIFRNLHFLLPYDEYRQRYSWFCENALHQPSFISFTISKFRSDLTPLWTTFRCNNISCISITDCDLSKSTFVVAIRSISPKIQQILWECHPSTNFASNEIRMKYYICFFQ